MSMLVHGDRRSRDDPRALCRDLLADCAEVARGGDVHDASMRVFVASSELAQGLVDRAFAARGEVDDLGPFERLAGRLTLAAARLLLGRGLPRDVAEVVHTVLRAALPPVVDVRVPEGYASPRRRTGEAVPRLLGPPRRRGDDDRRTMAERVRIEPARKDAA